MMNSRLKIAEISDVHLGHHKTPASHIIENLNAAFPDNDKTGELDIIWIAGDLFDRMLNLPSDSVSAITNWVSRFLMMCKRRDILVRVLEGTPSHDWKQAKLLVDINEGSKINADLKYFTELSIEHIDKFGIDILYVPDEWRSKNEHTWVEVQELLKEHNLEKVDFTIMHGCFNYQVPAKLLEMFETHEEANYLSITRYLIFNGHIHQHSQYDRILVAGSFDRLQHGEEGDKGHIRCVVEPNGTFTATFVVNENAMRYYTVDYTGVPVDEVYRQLDELVAGIPIGSHIRIQADADDAIFKSGTDIKGRYPQIHLTFKSNQRVIKIEPIVRTEIIRPVNLSKETIFKLITDNLTVENKSDVTNLLGELLNEYSGTNST